MNEWMAWGGVAAAAALVGSFWRQVVSGWQIVKSQVIVSFECHDYAAEAVVSYCYDHLKTMPWGIRSYCGYMVFVRSSHRREAVIAETVGKFGRVFWNGWKPVWIGRGDGSESKDLLGHYRPVTVSFLRGSLTAEQFLEACVANYNRRKLVNHVTRFHVKNCHGTAGKQIVNMKASDASARGSYARDYDTLDDIASMKLLFRTLEDIGPSRPSGIAVDRLALNEAAARLAELIRNWAGGELWHRAREVPWKLGCLLYGEPGNGKTALVRALAQDLSLPVFSYDLATFHNDELREQWQEMLSETPCIALIEDIDGVFIGREPASTNIDLTFDCLLNCIDGVERADGVLLFVTTNRPELLDDALAGYSKATGSEMATRPGRIDYSVQMGPPDHAGRLRLARRILADHPDSWDEVVQAGSHDSGAQFERRCINIAVERRWGMGVRTDEVSKNVTRKPLAILEARDAG